MFTVAIPAYNAKEIAWLAMESLCNQVAPGEEWEIVIAEEQNEQMFGQEAFVEYAERLQKVGCTEIKYKALAEKISLSEKWFILGEMADPETKAFFLQACDCYSPDTRLKETMKEFNDHPRHALWVQYLNGYFYDIGGKIVILYTGLQEAKTHLNMAFSGGLIKHIIPGVVKETGIDSWLFDSFEKQCPIKLDIPLSYDKFPGVDTHGCNHVSGSRGTQFHNPTGAFMASNRKITDLVPDNIAQGLEAIYKKRIEQRNNPASEPVGSQQSTVYVPGVGNVPRKLRKVAPTTANEPVFVNRKAAQCCTSIGVMFFDSMFRTKFKLEPYTDHYAPAVFFGVYHEQDYKRIMEHQGEAIVVWAGSDSMAPPEKLGRLLRPNIHHIAGSKWIADDLTRAGLGFKFVPISCIVHDRTDVKALPLGEKIYIYTAEKPEHAKFYGSELYNELIAKYGASMFHIGIARKFTQEYLYKTIMPDCFIGLRLVPHDGLSETVSELGLFGRRVIYNGCEPNALPYETYSDIVAHIENEKLKIGQVNEALAEQMREYLNVGDNWLNTKFYR